jgi:hypothetical protein
VTVTADFLFLLIHLPQTQRNLSRDLSYLSPQTDGVPEVNNRPVYYSQRLSCNLQLVLLLFCVVLRCMLLATVRLRLEQSNAALD